MLSSINLKLEGLGLLPSEDFTTEMTIGGRLLENRIFELEVLDDAARSEVEVLLDNLHELLGALGTSSVVKNSDRKRLSHSNSV